MSISWRTEEISQNKTVIKDLQNMGSLKAPDWWLMVVTEGGLKLWLVGVAKRGCHWWLIFISLNDSVIGDCW